MVPGSHAKEIIRLAHSNPLSGHFSTRKTAQRVEAEFFVPKLRKQVSQYIKRCHECQLVRETKVKGRQPLQPIHVLDNLPFEDLTMDILGGQLPITTRKNRYVLMIICNATGWVEALPLRNCKAETIADELLKFFCQKGFPKIIRSDNMASFKSEILTAVRQKLGVEARFSMAHNSQSHGKIERDNRTIEQMLKKFISEQPKNWDLILHLLCFAICELPSETTLFHPLN